MASQGVLLGRGGLYYNKLRLEPPLCIIENQVEQAIDCLETVIKNIKKKYILNNNELGYLLKATRYYTFGEPLKIEDVAISKNGKKLKILWITRTGFERIFHRDSYLLAQGPRCIISVSDCI